MCVFHITLYGYFCIYNFINSLIVLQVFNPIIRHIYKIFNKTLIFYLRNFEHRREEVEGGEAALQKES